MVNNVPGPRISDTVVETSFHSVFMHKHFIFVGKPRTRNF